MRHSPRLDERALDELITCSQDLQVDAMRTAREAVPDLRDFATERASARPGAAAAFASSRRDLLKRLGLGAAAAAGAGTAFGGTLASILATPAGPAHDKVDIQILQTASSLEKLAVATYATALTLPFIKDGNKVVVAFAETTMTQHDEHRKAFQTQTQALGGQVQDAPNPKYKAEVDKAAPNLKTPADVVNLAMTLENVARDTYLADLALFDNTRSREIMATVMGVETQHLATLRAVAALLATPETAALIAIPTDPSKLPAAAGSVGFPEAIPTPKFASPPEEGAIR